MVFLSTFAFAQDFNLGIGRLVSPGDLAKSHTKWNRLTECLKCHDLAGGVNSEKCIDCHETIKKNIEEKGYHSHYTVKNKKCEKCHPDHKGPSYNMIVWGKDGKKKFDHSFTQYPLRDKHKKTDCENCHTGKTKTGKQTYIGLESDCLACHKDIHEKTLGQKCDDCHINERSFKGLDVKFNHDRQTKYRLDGKHKKVSCGKCHTGQTKNRAVFKVGEYKRCISCHAKSDTHKGTLGKDCEKCHTVESWKKVASFDHKRTRYSLEGKHANVKCVSCHQRAKQGDYKVAKYDRCTSAGCHDTKSRGLKTHGDQFKSKRCDSCHVVSGWEPSLFSHDSTSYKGYRLHGKHRKAKCSACHTRKNSLRPVRYKPIDASLCANAGCHDIAKRGAIHGKQFGERDCSKCHTQKRWKPSVFDHTKARYQLYGKHLNVKCEECHKKALLGGSNYKGKRYPKVNFKPIKFKKCNESGCHVDPHKRALEPRPCANCHVDNSFKDMESAFDHKLDTSFPLTGKHTKAKCAECHTVRNKKVWKPVKEDCYSCHKKDDKHKGALGKVCSDCHHTTSWDAKAVAHEETGFPLTQTHAQLVCVDCHTKGGADFSGLSRDCQQCHSDPHLNQMGRICSDCHTMRNWEPLRFKHILTGFRLEGAHRYAECADCHKYRIYRVTTSDCKNCHLADFFSYTGHSPANTDCRECHSQYSFYPARGASHSYMTFTGAHAAIKSDCKSCHASTSGGATYWPGARFENDCVTCHMNDYRKEHRTCPTACTLCHRTSDWDDANKSVSCD